MGPTTRDADEQNDGAGYFEYNSHVQSSRNTQTDLNLQSVKTKELTLLSKSYAKHWLKLQRMNWNEIQTKNSWKNYAFFWPYFYDPPAPDRPLIQMKNLERGEGTLISKSDLMATYVQAWGRHCPPETNVDHTTNI